MIVFSFAVFAAKFNRPEGAPVDGVSLSLSALQVVLMIFPSSVGYQHDILIWVEQWKKKQAANSVNIQQGTEV